jgi:hypothetical protein
LPDAACEAIMPHFSKERISPERGVLMTADARLKIKFFVTAA